MVLERTLGESGGITTVRALASFVSILAVCREDSRFSLSLAGILADFAVNRGFIAYSRYVNVFRLYSRVLRV